MWKGTFETNDGAVYQVRGLTVGEKSELAFSGAFEVGSSGELLKVYSAEKGIVSWRRVPVYDQTGKIVRKNGLTEYVPADASIDDLPFHHLIEVGDYIFNELSVLDEEQELKLRGLIRFKFWFGDESREEYRKTFNCSTCIEKGYDKRRNCGLEQEKKDIIRRQIEDRKTKERVELARKQNERIHKALVNRKSRKRRVSINKPEEDKLRIASGTLSILGFVYDECPMSWIPTGLKQVSDHLYYAVKNGQMIVPGALFDQPAILWEAGRVLVAEGSVVESKMMESKRGR